MCECGPIVLFYLILIPILWYIFVVRREALIIEITDPSIIDNCKRVCRVLSRYQTRYRFVRYFSIDKVKENQYLIFGRDHFDSELGHWRANFPISYLNLPDDVIAERASYLFDYYSNVPYFDWKSEYYLVNSEYNIKTTQRLLERYNNES